MDTLHYHPEKNWINDPNGLVFFNGLFHIYYQHNPYGNNWGNISWGHAVTKDFITYNEENLALKCDMEYDKDGCFSGNSIVIDDVLYVYYTSVCNGRQTQSVAHSKDGYNFIKYDKNPIIATPFEARDPYVFMYKKELYMLLGAQNKVMLFKGKNPFEFEYISDLIVANEFIECPNLVDLGHTFLFKFSSMKTRTDRFFIGDFDGLKFTAKEEVNLNLPDNYYASQIFNYKKDNIIIGWIFNKDYKTDKPYNGCLSVPRIIEFKDKKVITRPYPTLEKFMDNNRLIDAELEEKF